MSVGVEHSHPVRRKAGARLMKAGAALSALVLLGGVSAAGADFTTGDKQFLLDGEPFQIRSGEIHYPRVPEAEWRNRIRMAKAMGLNTICTYVFWNYHETKRGEFDFSGEKDVARFIRICGEEGMKAIVRPGPYVCAEWDLGGIPAWILAEKGVKLRTTDARYLEPAKEWLKRMAAMIEPLTVAKGGPVIMVQVENELANFSTDRAYMLELQKALRAGGYTGMLFTCDGPFADALEKGGIPGTVKAVNFGRHAGRAFSQLETANPGQPPFTVEFWVGWFDQWQRPHNRGDLREKAEDLEWIMKEGASFNLYMFHGGSTRGMWTGANWDGKYRPTTCGYDYDAPLDESGRPTAKYQAFRYIIGQGLKEEKLPEIPAVAKPGAIGTIALKEHAALPMDLATVEAGEALPSMEDAGQGQGFILYQGTVEGPREASLDLSAVKDRVHVLLDGALAGVGGRSVQDGTVRLEVPEGSHTIGFLVENMGRLNFGDMDRERKGLEELPDIGGVKPAGVRYGLLPAERPPAVPYKELEEGTAREGITLLRGKFKCASSADTWLDLRGFGRGTVWLNGRNLGRYWEAGPSQTIFVPAAWLEADKDNELVVMELEKPACPLAVPTVGHQIWDVRPR